MKLCTPGPGCVGRASGALLTHLTLELTLRIITEISCIIFMLLVDFSIEYEVILSDVIPHIAISQSK